MEKLCFSFSCSTLFHSPRLNKRFTINCPISPVRARELKFWQKFHLPWPVRCHVSCVTYHMSCVTCHMWRVLCHFFSSFFGKGGEISRWRVCHQWGLPRLVLKIFAIPCHTFDVTHCPKICSNNGLLAYYSVYWPILVSLSILAP